MTDSELLAMCQAAFEAIPVAANARKALKKLGKSDGAYIGNRSHVLADVMARMIDDHLKGGI